MYNGDNNSKKNVTFGKCVRVLDYEQKRLKRKSGQGEISSKQAVKEREAGRSWKANRKKERKKEENKIHNRQTIETRFRGQLTNIINIHSLCHFIRKQNGHTYIT